MNNVLAYLAITDGLIALIKWLKYSYELNLSIKKYITITKTNFKLTYISQISYGKS